MASGADAAPTLPTHIHIQMCKDRENGAKAKNCGWEKCHLLIFQFAHNGSIFSYT